jgi:DNA-binding CsgD family transcriptional regulator
MCDVDIAERRAQVVELTRQGLSTPQIADKLGITDRSVQRHKIAAGIAVERHPLLSEAETRWAEMLLDDGCPYAEVARTLDRSISTIRRVFPGRTWSPSDNGQCVRMLARFTALEKLSWDEIRAGAHR